MYRREILQEIDLSEILKPFVGTGKWIALSKDEREVKGSGFSPQEALEESKKNGEEAPIFVKAPIDLKSSIS